MKSETKNKLLGQLAQYGYELSVPGTPVSAPEKVLEELLKQDDARLLEGFPVVLAHALPQKGALTWEQKAWDPAKAFSGKAVNKWRTLMAESVLLFRLFGTVKEAENRALKLLRKDGKGEKTLAELEKKPADEEVKTGGLSLSPERLKTTFRNYLVRQDGFGKEFEAQKSALEYELLLSELFTPRQKELLHKRLTGKTMTKTEREYYYRVVKKRLVALADPRLHEMARQLV
jgi:hypothetical protein